METLQFSPSVFDPNKEQLHAIAEEVRSITADPEKMTKEDLELINSTKNKLVKARTSIEKAGKAAREAANKYNKDVISYEDELIAIIKPEEIRLKELETAAKEHAMKQERLKTLPEFITKLESIGDGIKAIQEELLKMDPNERDVYYNGRLMSKLEADKAAAEAKRIEDDAAREAENKKLEAEREKIENEKRSAIAEKVSARIQRVLTLGYREVPNGYQYMDSPVLTRDVIAGGDDHTFDMVMGEATKYVAEANAKKAREDEEKRQSDIKAAEDKARAEAEEKARLEKEAEAKKKADEEAEKARIAEEERIREIDRTKAAEYQKWLESHAYDEVTDIVSYKEGVATLYRKVSEYTSPK